MQDMPLPYTAFYNMNSFSTGFMEKVVKHGAEFLMKYFM